MNYEEFCVLWAANSATTAFRRPGHDFEATAAQIAEHMRDDAEEYGTPFGDVDARWVGARLGQLVNGPMRSEPLVEKVDSRRWRISKAGLAVMVA